MAVDTKSQKRNQSLPSYKDSIFVLLSSNYHPMRILFICLLFTFFSCKEQVQKQSNVEAVEQMTVAKTIKNPSQLNSQTPNLFSKDNVLWMSWLRTIDSTDYLRYARYKNGTWSKRTSAAKGRDWFVNWADFPAIATNGGNVLTNILQKSDSGAYTYDVKLNLITSLKNSLKPDTHAVKRDFLLHTDGTKSEHGFVSLQPYGEKSFYAVWLDGRNTGAGMDHDSHSSTGGAMTLRGAVISEKGEISREEELDNCVCDCCQTDLIVTTDNQIIAAYRDRSDDEIRDIKIKKWNEASGWSEAIKVGDDNWKIAGCPVNGPALSAYDTNYAVAWFSAANDVPKVQLSFGKTMNTELGAPISINSNPTMGRVDVVMVSNTEAVVSWIEDKGDDTLIQLLKVNKNGSKGEVFTVSKTNAARASGFPRMAVIDDNLMIAYTLIERDLPSRIETKTVALKAL